MRMLAVPRLGKAEPKINQKKERQKNHFQEQATHSEDADSNNRGRPTSGEGSCVAEAKFPLA